MSSNENKTIIISGAGLAGALEGVLLKEQVCIIVNIYS